MLAAARDKSGGTVSGTIATELQVLSPGLTEVRCHSAVDLTGRLVAVGRGMIEGVAGEIIGQFIANVRRELECGPETASPEAEPGNNPPPAPAPPNLLVIIMRTCYRLLGRKIRRLFGLGQPAKLPQDEASR